MLTETTGFVLREVTYKESDRMLTLLTENLGKVTVKAQGALRKNSKFGAATQQLTYSEFALREFNGRLTVAEASVKEPFSGIRMDIEKLSLASYFSECISTLCPDNEPVPELLQLLLNSVYALSMDLYSNSLVKAAFELRLASLSGYCPQLDGCEKCGRQVEGAGLLSLPMGAIFCPDCCPSAEAVRLDADALRAARHIISAPAKRMFPTPPTEDSLHRLQKAAERYFLYHMDTDFSTLDYYKSLLKLKNLNDKHEL